MKKIMSNISILSLIVVVLLASCTPKQKYETITQKDANGYSYTEVTNDPTHTRIYQLENGLKIYLSVNKEKPRIQTYIPVRAGSSYDPKETTGLAHYLEHMMFKGTSKIGTIDWPKEKALIQKISDLYEKHKNTEDLDVKAAIYKQIDEVSQQASKYAIANEYDKLMSLIGAKGTNAYTSTDRTVYVNNIPSNELERWLQIESERFSELTLRLFHTEIEAVYEEFNMSQDREGTQVWNNLFRMLYPNHPYGTQTTIGEAAHLKNPSMININKYHDKYYVPNNMAICLAGDIDMEETVKLIDKYWGQMEKKPVAPMTYPETPALSKIEKADVYGPQMEMLYMAYRFNGEASTDYPKVKLIDMLMSNSVAGLLDLDINQQQKMMASGSFTQFMQEFGAHCFYAVPKPGQTLEEAESLINQEVEKIKKGEFDTWLIQAVINNLKKDDIAARAKGATADKFVDSFIAERSWNKCVDLYDEMAKLTKEDIMKFANENYKNYAIVYKRKGKLQNITKVDKPAITSVPINRTAQSEFVKMIANEDAPRLSPVFIDYKNAIHKEKMNDNVTFYAAKNSENDLFNLTFRFEVGKLADKKLEYTANLIEYLGTKNKTAEEFKKELYKEGIDFQAQARSKYFDITISGLSENMTKGEELVEDFLKNVTSNQEALDNMVKDDLKIREEAKNDKNTIFRSNLLQYALHGKHNKVTDIISAEEMKKLKAEELVTYIKNLTSYPHKIIYYGPKDANDVVSNLKKTHYWADNYLPKPAMKDYTYEKTEENKVYFVHYDMVQAFVRMINNKGKTEVKDFPKLSLFNEYYGGGMGSIVFQEIRESRALAYSAWSYYTKPYEKNMPSLLYANISTQADKFDNALKAMDEILTDMPLSQVSFDTAKESIRRKIESERITGNNLLFTYLENEKMGYTHDLRKDVYEYAKVATLKDINDFFNNRVKSDHYTIIVEGNRSKLTPKRLSKFGKVEELSLEEIFNY
ncbi:insulinase family protein [Halosquirtibacter xylanolyticus]|uniref:M16 family metallopeptidase n=1 Tax=Halosquirtibacter xylanolyticus TaxID=3374599 RepID=UPI00374A4E5F|nr:insulinase family protein [Prolixibacteraceae bacterium]